VRGPRWQRFGYINTSETFLCFHLSSFFVTPELICILVSMLNKVDIFEFVYYVALLAVGRLQLLQVVFDFSKRLRSRETHFCAIGSVLKIYLVR